MTGEYPRVLENPFDFSALLCYFIAIMKTDESIPKEKLFQIHGMMSVPYLLCVIYFVYAIIQYASAETNGAYSSLFYLIHGPIHEIGHFFFSSRVFPLMVHVLAGTAFQWLAPIGAGIQFIRTREFPALAVCLGWLGFSMLDSMAYMRDANVLELQLTSPFAGGGEIIHDWQYIFGHTGMLRHAETIGNVTGFFGYIFAGASILWILFMLGYGFRETFRRTVKCFDHQENHS